MISRFASTTKTAPGAGQPDHLLHPREVLLQLGSLTVEEEPLLLRVELEGVLLLPPLELLQASNLLPDRLEVGQHTAEPALRDVEAVRPLGLLLEDVAKLVLRADEEETVASHDHLASRALRILEAVQRLAEVDDVDPVAFGEDELAHLRVPPAGLVSEVDARLQKLVESYLLHTYSLVDVGPIYAPVRIVLRTVVAAAGPRRAPRVAFGAGLRPDRRGEIRTPINAWRTGTACAPSAAPASSARPSADRGSASRRAGAARDAPRPSRPARAPARGGSSRPVR